MSMKLTYLLSEIPLIYLPQYRQIGLNIYHLLHEYFLNSVSVDLITPLSIFFIQQNDLFSNDFRDISFMPFFIIKRAGFELAFHKN